MKNQQRGVSLLTDSVMTYVEVTMKLITHSVPAHFKIKQYFWFEYSVTRHSITDTSSQQNDE